MKVVTKDDYLIPRSKRYQGHPLINALPAINSASTIRKILRLSPEITDEERTFTPEEKLHEIAAILDSFFHPTEAHLELEHNLSLMIRQGYLNRNLADKSRLEYLLKAKGFLEEYQKVKKDPEYKAVLFQEFKTRYNEGSKAFMNYLAGCAGTGKSTVVQALLETYPQVLIHEEYQHTQLVWLKLECPSKGSEKTLCINFFQAIDNLLGTDYKDIFVKPRVSTEILLSQMVYIASLHSIGLLVIDEIQYLYRCGETVRESLIDFFVMMSNTINIPVLFIGTPRADIIFGQTLRLARRVIPLGGSNGLRLTKSGSLEKGSKPDEDERGEWEKFFLALWKLQWFVNPVPPTLEMSNLFYDRSQGIPHIAVALFYKCQNRAISLNRELIDYKMVNYIYNEKFSRVHPMIAALKNNNLKQIMKYSDLDLPINDIINDNSYSEEPAKINTTSYNQGKLPKLTSLLVRIGRDEHEAHQLAREAIDQYPDENLEILLANIIALNSSKPAQNQPQKKKVEKLKPIYAQNDIRLLWHDDPEEIYSIFERDGLIEDLEESLQLGRYVKFG